MIIPVWEGMHLLSGEKNIEFIALFANLKKGDKKMLKRILYFMTLLLVPLLLYSCSTINIDDLPEVSQTKENDMIVQREVDPDDPQRIYSIQTGKFKKITYIQNHFDSMIKEFTGKGVDYVRLVKVGDYYVVRLGKFNGHAAAKKFLMANQSQLPAAIIVDNYPSKLISVKKGLDRDGPQKIYSVQTASFVLIADARSHFKSMIREFNGKGVDYVRLVKVGDYYAVRLGKFDGYTAAKKFLMANQSQLPSASIVDNYPLRKKISPSR
jgi:hypothetical protein